MFNFKCPKHPAFNSRNGIAVLPVMLVVGAIVVEIAIVGGILAFFSSTSNLAIRSSQEALFTARAGAEDALIKILRDKDYTCDPSSPSEDCLLTMVSGGSQTTAVTSVVTSGLQRIITASSTVKNRTKTVQVKVNVNDITGKIDVVSFEEIIN